jgi:hypothetical protein
VYLLFCVLHANHLIFHQSRIRRISARIRGRKCSWSCTLFTDILLRYDLSYSPAIHLEEIKSNAGNKSSVPARRDKRRNTKKAQNVKRRATDQPQRIVGRNFFLPLGFFFFFSYSPYIPHKRRDIKVILLGDMDAYACAHVCVHASVSIRSRAHAQPYPVAGRTLRRISAEGSLTIRRRMPTPSLVRPGGVMF